MGDYSAFIHHRSLPAETLSQSLAGRARAQVQEISTRISLAQWRPESGLTSYISRQLAGHTKPGLFPSRVHFGHFFLGKGVLDPDLSWLSRRMELIDTNMFATAIITNCLLETEQLNKIRVAPRTIDRAVSQILSFRDKNLPEGSPAFCFWQQHPTSSGWKQNPDNISTLVNYLRHIVPPVMNVMQRAGFEIESIPILASPDLRAGFTEGESRSFLNRFNMPPDLDDTGWALTLGATLMQSAQYHPESARRWQTGISNWSILPRLIERYAYQPRSADPAVRVIDSRTYFSLRSFLHERDDPSLMTTWLQNIHEGEVLKNRPSKMPMNINNVDPSVCANILMGLHSSWLVNRDLPPPEAMSPAFQKSYRDTVDMICWVIMDNRLAQLPDLLILYYPNMLNFYRFTAANLQRLEAAHREGKLNSAMMAETRLKLGSALRAEGTRQILERSALDSQQNTRYWSGHMNDGKDTIYSSALALNTLLDIWTYRPGTSPECPLRWHPGTPDFVRTAIHQSCEWLVAALEQQLPLDNACYSGSVKGFFTIPFLFPENFELERQDQKITGFQGIVPEETYRELLAVRRTRRPGTIGLRSDTFTYWSSPDITRALSMLALAKYICLLEDPAQTGRLDSSQSNP